MTTAPARRAAALFALALLTRLAFVVAYPQLTPVADARDYHLLAASVAEGRGFVDPAGRPESLRAPLYPYFLAAVYRLAGERPQAARLVQALLGALVPLLSLRLARRHFAEGVAWAAAFAVALHPALIAYCGALLTETLATVLVCLLALAASVVWVRRTPWAALSLGVVLGFATLCRAEWITVSFALAGLMAIAPPSDAGSRRRIDLRTPVLVLLSFAVVLAPWTARNERALGGFAPVTTDGWRTLWIATYPAGWLEWKQEEPLLSIQGPESTPPLERARRFRSAALANLREDPLAYVRMCARRVVLLWVGGHSSMIAGLEASTVSSRGARLALKLLLLGLSTGIVGLAFAGMWMSRGRGRERIVLLVCIGVPSATYVMLFAVARYHVPLLPLLLPFAVEALVPWTPRLRKLGLAVHAADTRLGDRLLSGTPLHPAFWVYRRIGDAVKSAAATHVRTGGTLLDVGCGMKPYADVFAGRVGRHIGLEASREAGYAGNRADLVADAGAVALGGASCDVVLCTEVLEHVPAPARVVAEIARVLRPGGTAIVTVPFVYPVHDRHDYQRFTAAGLRALFDEARFEIVELRPLSYPLMTLSIMAALVVHDLCFVRSRYAYALSIPLRPILWLIVLVLNAFGFVGEALCRATSFPFNHLLVARRRS